MEFNRRQFILGGLGGLGFLVGKDIATRFGKFRTGLDSIHARNEPKRLPGLIGDPDPDANLLKDQDLRLIYNHNVASLVDPDDRQPLTSFATFKVQMYWINSITSVLYNQMDTKDRPGYIDFVGQYIEQACALSRFVNLHPGVFLETSIFSGQNVGGVAVQREDVKISSAQYALVTMQEAGVGLGGETAVEMFQQSLSDPYSNIFKPKGRQELQQWVDRLGLKINVDSDFRAMSSYDALRLLDPTIGMMDLEPIVYSLGYDFLKRNYPQFVRFVFKPYPEAVLKMEALINAKSQLDSARSALKNTALRLIKNNPDVLNEFFNETTAHQLFSQIGIGNRTYKFTRDFYIGCQWDADHFAQAKGEDYPRLPLPRERYFEERRKYVLALTTEYWLDLYRKSPKEAKEALIADQIFNPDLINYLQAKVGTRLIMPLRSSLGTYENSAEVMRTAKLDSYPELGKLEYDWKFQAALSVATNRYLQNEVLQYFPKLKGDKRGNLYWQMYLITLLRETAPYPAVLEKFFRPDVDSPYNNQVVLQSFAKYYHSYIETELISNTDMNKNFEEFIKMEWRIYRDSFPEEYPPQDISRETADFVHTRRREFVGRHIYSSWLRAITVAWSLKINTDYPTSE